VTKFLSFILFLILILGGYLLLNFFQSNQTKKYTGPVEKIRIGNIGEYSIFNIIAQEKGYFTQNGLDAQIIEYESGPPSIDALLADKVDVAVAADFVGVNRIFTNTQLKILTQSSKHRVFYMLSRKYKGFDTPSKLKGKKIGVTRKSAGEFYLGQFLLYQNLKLTDIHIVDLPPSKLITQFESGQLDAIVIFDPHAYNLTKKFRDSINIWSIQSNQNIFALTYTTERFTRTHAETLKKYMRALFQAEEFTTHNPSEAQTIVAKKLHYEKVYMDHMWKNFIFTHGLDQELLLTMEDQARWIIENKLTDKKTVPNYLNFIYFDALDTLQSEAITITH
jgi:NitT/TauT family transport system substrate-binding protein